MRNGLAPPPLRGAPVIGWISVAASADGWRFYAASPLNGVYISTNGGATWLLSSAPPSNSGQSWALPAPATYWAAGACSSDGSKIVLAPSGSTLWQSSDFGTS
jgi:hypothetical protein